MNTELEQKKLDEYIEKTYQYLKACIDFYKVGKLLCSKGASDEQISKGELIMEMAAIYAERLKEFAAEVEVKLNLEAFESQNMISHLASLTDLRRGRGMEQLDQLVKELEEKTVQEENVQEEMSELSKTEDF